MSLRDEFAKYAGFQALSGGVDSDRSPALLGPTSLAWAINATMRNGFLKCRPGWVKRPLTFRNENGDVDEAVRDAFVRNGRWQGARGYLADDASTPILPSIGGHIFLINTTTYAVQDLTDQAGFTMSPVAPMTWMEQAENFLVIQNGEERGAIFDGSVLRQSNTKALGLGEEVPIGEAMAYVLGRLWVALPGGRSFVAGDLAFSTEAGRASVLSFDENDFLNGGGEFIVPASAGTIRAMRGVALQDSTTGQGPLQVMTTRGGFSVNAPFDRDSWASVTSPIQTVSLLSAGAVSQEGTINVNGDLWFRSPDGIRSFMIARRDWGTWVNTPLSAEVVRALDNDSAPLLNHSSAALFDNRLLMTCSPHTVSQEGTIRGVAHRGLVPLDFAPVSSMFNRSQPAWDGLWTGLDILQILTVDSQPNRCFAFTINAESEIELWELVPSARFDVAVPNQDTRIQWSFETPEYGFDTGGFNLRELAYGDLWFRRIAGTVDWTARYRPDADPNWQLWASSQVCTQYRDCDTGACQTPTTFLPQYRTRIRLPAPNEDIDPVTGKPFRKAYRFAARVEVTGYAELPQLRLVARDEPEEVEGAYPPPECSETEELTSAQCEDDFSYSIT